MDGTPNKLYRIVLQASVPSPAVYIATSPILEVSQYTQLLLTIAYLDITTLTIRYFLDAAGQEPFFSIVELLNNHPDTYISRQPIRGQYLQVELFCPSVAPSGPISYYVELRK